MKTAVSTYSFHKLINSGEMTQFDCIAKAKEMGFDAIEFVEVIPHDGLGAEEYAEKLRKETERLNIAVSNFTFGADFLNGMNGDTTAEIERVKKMIDLAAVIGAKSVRHDATTGNPNYRSFDAALKTIADACREVTEYAAQKGIKTAVENHGYFCQDSERVEKLFNAVNHPNFGLLTDMGNFLCADEDPARAFSRVAPYAIYAHAKDFILKSAMEPSPGRGFFCSRSGNYLRGTIVGHGVVPVKHCLTALKRAGYDGYVAIEFEGLEDTITSIETGLENLKRYISELD